MGKISIGINTEFVRHDDVSFEAAIEKAAELGFEYVEPWVHQGREMMSEAGYYMSVSMQDDPYRIKRACDKAGLKISGFDVHATLCKPEVSVEFLKQAVRFAAEIGTPVINTSEGIKADWTTEDEDFALIRYSLMQIAEVAEPRNVLIGIEQHKQYTSTPEGMKRICDDMAHSPAIGINFDTGNAYIAGQDPITWLESVVDKVVHVHAKDISVQHSDKERGEVTGTPAGCACGDGVIDWKKVIEILKGGPRDIVMSVECGTVEQAEKSLKYLKSML